MENRLDRSENKLGWRERGSLAIKTFFGTNSLYSLRILSPTTLRRTKSQPLYRNSAVMAGVSWKQRNFPQAKLNLVHKKGGGIVRMGDAPRTDDVLKLIKRKNPQGWIWSEVCQALVYSLDCNQGNAYLFKNRYKIVIDPKGSKEEIEIKREQARKLNGKIAGLTFLESHHISPEVNTEKDKESDLGWIDYYKYAPNGGEGKKFEVDDIIHFRIGIDPDNPRRGYSALDSNHQEVASDNEATSYLLSILVNLGIVGAVISPKDNNTNFDEDTKTELEEYYSEKSTGDNRGKPLVLSTPTDIQKSAQSPEEIGLYKIRNVPEDRISSATGINPMVTGLTSGKDSQSFSNFKEALGAAYDTVLIPLQEYIADKLNEELLPEFGLEDEFEFKWNYEEVRALQEDANKKAFRIIAQFEAGLITRDQALAGMGYPTIGGKDGEFRNEPSLISGRAMANLASPANNTEPSRERPQGGNGKSLSFDINDGIAMHKSSNGNGVIK